MQVYIYTWMVWEFYAPEYANPWFLSELFVPLPSAKRRTMEMCLHTQPQYWIRLIPLGAACGARDSMAWMVKLLGDTTFTEIHPHPFKNHVQAWYANTVLKMASSNIGTINVYLYYMEFTFWQSHLEMYPRNMNQAFTTREWDLVCHLTSGPNCESPWWIL